MDIRDAIKANNTAIEAIDLVKDYGSGSNAVHALRDVNIAFEQGKFTVIPFVAIGRAAQYQLIVGNGSIGHRCP